MGLLAALFVVLGAGLMYFLDPRGGRRRRALLRDQLAKAVNRSQDRVEALSKDVPNRAKGAVLEAQKRLQPEEVDDPTLAARVRAKMGRVVSHPGAINVLANQGHVTLSGHVLANEVQPLIATVRDVPGVAHVENQLQVDAEAANIPDLQS